MLIQADLHIHSCLSPCATLEMSPQKIVETATAKSLKLISVTDHNSALNCAVIAKACEKAGINFLPGIEATTREEVHVLCYFDTIDQALELGEFIYKRLPNIQNDPKRLGDQVYVNEKNEILGHVKKYLGLAADISLEDLNDYVAIRGGLFIPAHINRPLYGLTKHLGFLPNKANYSAVEVHRMIYLHKMPIPDTGKYPVICNSDAHEPESIGCIYNQFEVEEISCKAIAQALKKNKIMIASA